MRQLKKWALLLCTLLLTVLGAVLPHAVSAIQDANVENAAESRPFDPVNLRLVKGGGIQEVMQLLAGSVDEMEWPGNTRMTPEEAAEAAAYAVIRMYRSNLIRHLPGNFTEMEISAQPHFVMSMNESSASAVLWICELEDMPGNFFYIDDETGKIVRAFMDTLNLDMSVSMASTDAVWASKGFEETVERLEQWRVFLSEYYGMELEFGDMWEYDDGYSMYCTLSFDTGTPGTKGVMAVELHGSVIYFNP